MARLSERSVALADLRDSLSAAHLELLWQFAKRLQQCDSVADAESLAAAAAAATDLSPAALHAIAETVGLAIDRIRERERLRDLAICDPLTGLSNRRFMEEELSRQVHRAIHAGEPLAVAMLDLDRFRDYNERHGHLAGDLVLRSCAVLLQGFRQGSDMPCRYGGEEFVVIMPQASAAQARDRLDPFRHHLTEIQVYHEGRLLPPITASIGVAELPVHGRSAAALLGAADEAMYRAKRAGRNRLHVAGDAWVS